MSAPLVTTIMATYRGAPFVREAVESVLAQRGPRHELVVCDDGSDDGTVEILEGFGDAITLLRTRRAGVSAARNAAAAVARGRHLAFLDQDDRFLGGRLERTVSVLEARPELGFVYADAALIDASGVRFGARRDWLDYREGALFDHLLTGNCVPVETLTLPRERFEAVGGFDPRYDYLEDFALCLAVARTHPVAFLPEELAAYRIHDRNLSHAKRAMVEEFVRLLDDQLVGGDLSAPRRELVVRERARRLLEAAWAALREGDLAEARALSARAEGLGPHPLARRVRWMRRLLGLIPAAPRRALLARWPARRLYGVRRRR